MATSERFQPTTDSMTLVCRLVRHIITDDGDFIPAGTPVMVLGWSGNDQDSPESPGRTPERIAVRTAAYMYADTFDYDGDGAVGRGLCLDVEPDNLVYDAVTR